MPNDADGQQLLQRILREYGWNDPTELEKSHEFADALSRAGGDAYKAIKFLASKRELIAANGWYLNEAKRTEWDADANTRVVVGTGPRVLLSNGDVRSLIGRNVPEGLTPMTPVRVDNLLVRKNIESGQTRISVTDDTAVNVANHTDPVPQVPLTDAIENCFEKNKRGTIFGSTRFGTTSTLTVSDNDADVTFWLAEESEFSDEDVLRVKARDNDNNVVSIKPNVNDICEQLGVHPNDVDADFFKSQLVGEALLVYGNVGVTNPINESDFPDFNEDTGESRMFRSVVQELIDEGHMRSRARRDGTALKSLDMTNVTTESGEAADFVPIGPFQVYDLVEKSPDVWDITVLAEDQGNTPWFDCKEHPWTSTDGERSGVNNEGAFCILINHAGAAAPRDDKYSFIVEKLNLDAGDEDTGF